MILSPTPPQTASAYRYPYPPESIGLQISHGYIDGLNAIWWRTMHHTRGIGEANHHTYAVRDSCHTQTASVSFSFQPPRPLSHPPPSIAQAWLPVISPITSVGRGRQLVTYITPHITSIAQAWLPAISPITSVGRKAASDIHNAPHTSA